LSIVHFEDEARRITAKHRQASGAAQAAGLVSGVGVGADAKRTDDEYDKQVDKMLNYLNHQPSSSGRNGART
jgi:hypothetical protein